MTDTLSNQPLDSAIPSGGNPPRVAIGSCLIGEKVRFNGESKRRNPHIENFKKHFNLISICPEVGIGLGVPRETIRLVDHQNSIAVVATSQTLADESTINHAPALRAFAEEQLKKNDDFCGYILVKGSPSCGMEKVKRYNLEGNIIGHDAMGIFAHQIAQNNPLLPLEEDGRLNDPGLRESFVSRVYLLQDWLRLRENQISIKILVDFYSRYKYKVMSHHQPSYKVLGQLLADPHQLSQEDLATRIITVMMNALKNPSTRGSLTNTLQHIQGYLKNHLSPKDKQELSLIIQQYYEGIVPLITPMTLLQHHFSNFPDEYISEQVFMSPYPEAMALRSNI